MGKCRLIDRMPDDYSRDMHERCCAVCLASDDLGITLKRNSDA